MADTERSVFYRYEIAPLNNQGTQLTSSERPVHPTLAAHASVSAMRKTSCWQGVNLGNPGCCSMPHGQPSRCMLCRERAAGYYAELAWAAGEMVVELPYLLLQTCLYSVITYFMIWFEINAGERPTCILHAMAGQRAPWHPPTAFQGIVLAMCLYEHCSDRNLRDRTCPHDADLLTCSKDASDTHCLTLLDLAVPAWLARTCCLSAQPSSGFTGLSHS